MEINILFEAITNRFRRSGDINSCVMLYRETMRFCEQNAITITTHKTIELDSTRGTVFASFFAFHTSSGDVTSKIDKLRAFCVENYLDIIEPL